MSAPEKRNPSHVASDPAVSAWVSANAGAGKTYTLANRVTRLLLDNARPERILCLTYTKAAAAEMAKRLFDQLGKWSMLSDSDLIAALDGIGAGEAARNNLAKARRLFAQALETPGGLKIQTIHSFCQMLLSRFPVEAGIAPSFDVLDEQTARELMADARARVLERAAGGDMARASAIRLLITELGENTFTQVLDAALGGDQRKYERAMAGLRAHAADLGTALRQAHGARGDDTTDAIAAEFCEGIDKLWLDEIAGLMRGSNKTDKAHAELLLAAMGNAKAAEAFAGYSEYFLTKDAAGRKQLIAVKIAKDFPHHIGHLEDVQARAVAAEDRRRAAHAAQICEAAFSVIDAARAEYAAAKRARGMLDYNDLISKSVDLLDRKGAAAWVLYKLDGGLDHILIDEAQDTSPEQWQIVRKLTEEFFAGVGAREQTTKPRTIFAVGDEKQSIFSFQGADPAAFEANRDYFKKIVTDAGLKFEDVPLIESRRSVPQVLEFVDKVFASEDARAGLTLKGDEIKHTAHRSTEKGRVEFLPALKPLPKDDGRAWRRPIDEPSPGSPVVELAKLLAGRIATWVDGKHRLPGRDRAVRASDIMVLLGRREPFASEIIRQLKTLNVPVAGADRITLTEQISVMDLMALGRFVLLPEDDLNLATLLRSPLGGISEDELESLCVGRKSSIWAELEKRRSETVAFAAAHAFLSDMRTRADFVPPYEFYAQVLDAQGYRGAMLARLGPEAADAMDEFLSLALAYEAENTPSLEGFLRWIEKGETQIRRDME
ncbi:MAG TPA: double-strand break repair helicase AddA, partial [Rhizomicrobium sp.]|nr:double-strand break repair helicase AddA [Rhizomicrobium sp.]